MLENKITLRSVYKITRCIMEPALNPVTGRYPDVVRRVNADGDMIISDDDKNTGKFLIGINQSIEIYDGKQFDLDKEADAAWWEAIKYSKKIAQDRWEKDIRGNLVIDGNAARYGTAEFYVERPGVDAALKNQKKRLVHEAKSYVYGDSPDNLYQRARLLGNGMSGAPISDVEEYLISIAETKPNLITEIYTGTDTHLRLLLLDATDKGVIIFKNALYSYGTNIMLGANEQSVISYFKNPANKRILDLIKGETYPDLFVLEKQTIDALTIADVQLIDFTDLPSFESELTPAPPLVSQPAKPVTKAVKASK